MYYNIAYSDKVIIHNLSGEYIKNAFSHYPNR